MNLVNVFIRGEIVCIASGRSDRGGAPLYIVRMRRLLLSIISLMKLGIVNFPVYYFALVSLVFHRIRYSISLFILLRYLQTT